VRVGSFHPRNRGHYVVVVLSVEQLLNLSGLRVPQVDRLREAHREDVARAPVQEVEVVVIDEVRGVEDLLRELRYAPQCLLLFVSFFLCEGLYEGDVLVKREARPRLLLFEGEYPLVLSVVFLLLAVRGLSRDPGEPQLLLLGLLQSQGVGRAALVGKETLSDQFLEALLLLVARPERVLDRARGAALRRKSRDHGRTRGRGDSVNYDLGSSLWQLILAPRVNERVLVVEHELLHEEVVRGAPERDEAVALEGVCARVRGSPRRL